MKRGDLALIAAAGAVIALGALWFAFGHGGGAGGPLVVVTQSRDGFYQVNHLSDDVEFTVETTMGGTGRGDNVVRIQGGEVWVAEANCENQLCVEHAPISGAGEQIVCLPHGVVVQVAERAEDIARLG